MEFEKKELQEQWQKANQRLPSPPLTSYSSSSSPCSPPPLHLLLLLLLFTSSCSSASASLPRHDGEQVKDIKLKEKQSKTMLKVRGTRDAGGREGGGRKGRTTGGERKGRTTGWGDGAGAIRRERKERRRSHGSLQAITQRKVW
eukprot:287204-Hanusia_phi.AAC.1